MQSPLSFTEREEIIKNKVLKYFVHVKSQLCGWNDDELLDEMEAEEEEEEEESEEEELNKKKGPTIDPNMHHFFNCLQKGREAFRRVGIQAERTLVVKAIIKLFLGVDRWRRRWKLDPRGDLAAASQEDAAAPDNLLHPGFESASPEGGGGRTSAEEQHHPVPGVHGQQVQQQGWSNDGAFREEEEEEEEEALSDEGTSRQAKHQDCRLELIIVFVHLCSTDKKE